MKKLKLKALEISAGGLLTREQLRNVVGGSLGGHCSTTPECGGNGQQCINGYCVVPGGTGGIDCRQSGCTYPYVCNTYTQQCQ